MENLTLGADIEYFLQKDGRIISAEGIVKGSKHEPFNFDESSPFYATSLDNVLAEHCIPPVQNNSGEWVSSILKSQKYIESLQDGISIAAIPSARIDEEFLQTDNAKLFGWN